MSDVVRILPFSIDLDKPIEKTDLHELFVMGDSLAHKFEVTVTRGGTAVSLTGCTVKGYFTNFKENTTVEVGGGLEDGKAVVTLSKPCYALHGQFVLFIQIKSGEVETTIFHGEGFMRRSKTETIIYDDYVIYDVSTLLSQISAMRTATSNANDAADNADAKAAAANTAAENANKAAQKINDMTIDAAEFGIPVLSLMGDITQMTKDNAVTLDYVYGERTGTLTCKWQGSSSLAYPKKNYTIKFDEAFEAKSGWGAQSKYCLKANWVDASSLRNLFGAVIWGQMVKDRSGADARLTSLPNGGAVDGFPIWLVINDESQGLYSFNIPKDAWMFGMTGSDANEGFVCAEYSTFSGTAVCDGSDFKVEYCASEDPSSLIASLNNLITTVNNVQSADDLAALETLIDVNSVIDYYVFMAAACHDDGISKNYILGTYDGTKWFISAYDMDAIFGNSADGSGYGWANDWPMFTGTTGINQLLDVVRTYYADQIKTRFTNLRYWFLGEISLQAELYKLAVQIPHILIDEDFRLWPSRPGTATNNVGQMQEYIRLRMPVLDYNVTTM